MVLVLVLLIYTKFSDICQNLNEVYKYLSYLLIVHWSHKEIHTHTQLFNGPFSGTTQVSQYQKGKTNLDFTEARDSEWQ